MKETLVAFAGMIIAGMGIGFSLGQFIYVKKVTTVIIDQNEGNVSFESNVNNEGDRYYIILNKDTVSKSVIIDGKWE